MTRFYAILTLEPERARQMMRDALATHGGAVSDAAKSLGITPASWYRYARLIGDSEIRSTRYGVNWYTVAQQKPRRSSVKK